MDISLNKPALKDLDLSVPVALEADNFTSINRTPWAGKALSTGIKRNQAKSAVQKIGESWEISCDPEAPSKLRLMPNHTLNELIALRTTECLSGDLVASGRTTCDILIKLLNADSPLSLQIHPSDDNASLKPNECGKPESWLVLSAVDGAGLYLGFNKSLTVDDIGKRLETGTFTPDILQFVPVKAGDYFEIEPHVPHAIGPGVVLLEPQRILAGKSGKTWRLWDWNRKYNANGELDLQNGKPRELHICESLPLLDPSHQCGKVYLDTLMRFPKRKHPAVGVTTEIFPANQWYQTIALNFEAGSKTRFLSNAGYGCLTVISGEIAAYNRDGKRTIMIQGESFFIPAACLPIELAANQENTHLTLIIPAGQGVVTHDGEVFD